MNFQEKLADALQAKYGNSIAGAFDEYCQSEKLSEETLLYDLTKMTWKWSIMEVFLIDVLMLKNKDGQKIFKFMKQFASQQPGVQNEENKTDKTDKATSPISYKIKPKPKAKKPLPATKNNKNIKNENKSDDKSKKGSTESDTKWANLLCVVSMHSTFDNWKAFNYSKSDVVDTKTIQQRLTISKVGSGKFKIPGIGMFVYFRREKPKGYKLVVRCNNNSIEDAQAILDQFKSKLDAKLEGVDKVEKFKYKQCLDNIVKEIS